MLHWLIGIAAPNFLGIGEFLTGVIIGVVGLIVAVFIYILLDEWWEERKASGPEYGEPEQKAGRGTIICDYIERESLKTIARQRGVPLDPDRLERASGSGSEGGLAAGASGLQARFRRRKHQEQRAYYDEVPDYNLLLRQVLKVLEERYELNMQLGAVPLVDYMDESFMARLDEVARESERDAVVSIRDRMLREEKAREFETTEADSRFVLVESDWEVRRDEEAVILALTKLHRREEYVGGEYGSAQEAPMPPGIALEARIVEPEHLTTPGKNRLRPGTKLQAGVFGAVTSLDKSKNVLSISPTAVFARLGT